MSRKIKGFLVLSIISIVISFARTGLPDQAYNGEDEICSTLPHSDFYFKKQNGLTTGSKISQSHFSSQGDLSPSDISIAPDEFFISNVVQRTSVWPSTQDSRVRTSIHASRPRAPPVSS